MVVVADLLDLLRLELPLDLVGLRDLEGLRDLVGLEGLVGLEDPAAP